MAEDVQGPDYTGVGALADQWKLYGTMFPSFNYVVKDSAVTTVGDSTLVVANVAMTIRLNRRGVACVVPGFGGNEGMVHVLKSPPPLVVVGSVRSVFSVLGSITWFGTDMDFVTALLGAVGSPEAVVECLARSKLSLLTGRISPSLYPAEPPTHELPVKQDRHTIEYLLS